MPEAGGSTTRSAKDSETGRDEQIGHYHDMVAAQLDPQRILKPGEATILNLFDLLVAAQLDPQRILKQQSRKAAK